MMMAAKKKPEMTYDELVAENAGLRSDVKFAEAAHDALNNRLNDTLNQFRSLEKRLDQADADTTFERDRANAIEQRLQRMSGYLDRVMDEENQYKDPPSQVVKAPPAPKGPRVRSVSLPTRESSRPDAFPYSAHDFEGNRQYPEPTY